MLLAQFLGLEGTVKVAGYVSGIVVMAPGGGGSAWYALQRVEETVIGIGMAVLVSFIPKLLRVETYSSPRQLFREEPDCTLCLLATGMSDVAVTDVMRHSDKSISEKRRAVRVRLTDSCCVSFSCGGKLRTTSARRAAFRREAAVEFFRTLRRTPGARSLAVE